MKWKNVFEEIDTALEYFNSQKVKPTLRTLFYYLYSKQLIPNTKSAYIYLSKKLVTARKTGRYPWDFLEDKTRIVLGKLADYRFSETHLDNFEKDIQSKLEELNVESMINDYFDWLLPSFAVDFWAEQPFVVEIWIEKEALSSTIFNWVSDLAIPVRVNRGYSSWTFIYNNVKSLKDLLDRHEKVIIFYLGDLDPSGVDIQRFLVESLEYFNLNTDKVELKRLAITEEQVTKFNLPPRPEDIETLRKLERDPRYKSNKSFWESSAIVELDALIAYAPSEFRELVRNSILNYWNKEIYDKLKGKAKELTGRSLEILADMKEKAKKKILETLKES